MPTIKDVAEKAGVTVTTVSRILNNRGYISQKTREKVYRVMKELDYQPNEVARSLLKKRTNVIGVIVPSIRQPFFSEVVHFLEFYASTKSYKVMLCVSNHEKEKEVEYIEMLRSNQVSGIVLGSRTDDLETLLPDNLPVISFERVLSDQISSIACDNAHGGVLATKHLIESGCRKLIHVSGIRNISLPADARRDSFIRICKDEKIPHKVFYTREAQFTSLSYEEYLEQILTENSDVDGIFASSDVIAAEIIQVCSKIGIRIPEDLKLVGFDDIHLASLTTPQITTIHQPVEQMCAHAIDTLDRQINAGFLPSQTVLPVKLLRRETT